MTIPAGFVPRPNATVIDRLADIERRLRTMQQATAGATTAEGGVPLGSTYPAPIGAAASAGALLTSAHADHVHTSALATQQDVSLIGPVAGNVLAYNGTKWAAAPKTLATDTDVTISAPASGQALTYNGSQWTNTTPTLDGQVLLGRGLAGTLSATVYTTSGTTELNIPKLALLTVPVVAGRAYLFNAYLYVNPSVANSDYWFRVRTSTALTGTEIVRWNIDQATGGLDQMVSCAAPWIATFTGSMSFYLSAQQMIGSGSLNICAGSAFWVADAGAPSQWSYT